MKSFTPAGQDSAIADQKTDQVSGEYFPRLSVSTIAYHGYDLGISLREISRIGVSLVEPAFIVPFSPEARDENFSASNAHRLSNLLRDYGLESIAVAAHMDLGFPTSTDSFHRRLEYTAAIGARFVHTHTTKKVHKAQFMHNIDRLVRIAEQLDVIITIENPGDAEDAIFSTARSGVDIIKEIGSDRVRLNYDFGNAFSFSQGKINVQKDFLTALPIVSHFHLKDLQRSRSGWAITAIGSGVIKYQAVLGLLATRCFELPMAIELPFRLARDDHFHSIWPPRDAPPSLAEIRNALMNSIQFVRQHFVSASFPSASISGSLGNHIING